MATTIDASTDYTVFDNIEAVKHEYGTSYVVNAGGKKVEQVKLDTERDKFMSAKEALAYGLIDRIVSKTKPAAK